MTALQAELPLEEGIDAILRDTADRIDELYRAASEPGARPPWMTFSTGLPARPTWPLST